MGDCRVEARCLDHICRLHPCYLLDRLRRILFHGLRKGSESLGPFVDKGLVGPSVRDDRAYHAVYEGHIRARPLPEPHIRVVDELDPPRVGDDQLLPVFRTAFLTSKAMTGWFSVVLEPMTKMQSALDISSMELVIAPLPNAIARPATVELCQRRAQWSTLFVPITALASFCEQVIFFVGAFRGDEETDGVRPVLLLHPIEAGCNLVESFIPLCLPQAPILSHERRGKRSGLCT